MAAEDASKYTRLFRSSLVCALGLVMLLTLAGCGSQAANKHANADGLALQHVLHANASRVLPTIDTNLLLAYAAPNVALHNGDADRFCGDFTNRIASSFARAVAQNLKMSRGSSCTASVSRLFAITGITRRGATSRYGWQQALSSVAITDVKQHGTKATASIIGFYNRNAGSTITFQRISGRWLVASAPNLEGSYFACIVPCKGAGEFTLSYRR